MAGTWLNVGTVQGMRSWVAVGVLALLPMFASGCSVPMGGVAGIGVDSAGNPVGYLRVCQDHIDGATLYPAVADGARSRWAAGRPVTGFARWSLTAPADGWRTEAPWGRLEPGTTYDLYGWTRDNSSSTWHAAFTPEDLADLEPGQVRWNEDDPQVTSTIGIFVKDSGLVADAAATAGADVPVLAAARDRYLAAAEAGLDRADDSQVIRTYRS